MPKWSDFGNIFSTLRELDVNAIRDEAERQLQIAIVGHDTALDEIDRLLHSGASRYPAGPNPLDYIRVGQIAERGHLVNGSDLVILALDARNPLSEADAAAFSQLDRINSPFLIVLLFAERLPTSEADLPRSLQARTLALPDPHALEAADTLASTIFSQLSTDLHLSAARRLAGVRGVYARDLIGSTSFTNATYALASGLPEQIPILSVPFAAADILVLTKNQAMLVYKLALAYGAQADFQARIREVLPVIGGAFLWRQAARSLIGLIPIWGLVPKIAVAYAGTYTTGVAAWRWYDSGEIVSTSQLKRISNEAIKTGRARAKELIDKAKATGTRIQGTNRGFFAKLKGLVTRKKPAELPPPSDQE